MSKFHYYLSCIILLAAFATSPLHAAGWGSTDDVIEFEGNDWDGVYLDMNGVKLNAYIPNYSGSSLQDGTVAFTGEADGEAYLIISTLGIHFKPPKSQKEFVKLIKDNNPDFNVNPIDGSPFGAKYAVDLIPSKDTMTAHWRFLYSAKSLIQMGTDDANEARRQYFFDSIFID